MSLSNVLIKEKNSKPKRDFTIYLIIRTCYRISQLQPPKTFKLYYGDKGSIEVPGDEADFIWEGCIGSWVGSITDVFKEWSKEKSLPTQYIRIYKQLLYIERLQHERATENLSIIKNIQGPLWESHKFMNMQKKQAQKLRSPIKKLYQIMLKDMDMKDGAVTVS